MSNMSASVLWFYNREVTEWLNVHFLFFGCCVCEAACKSCNYLTPSAPMLKIVQAVIRWIVSWMYFVSLICLIGAMGGVLSHVLFALIVKDQPDLAYFAAFGFLNGLNYGGVWAGGAAIVLCVLRARKEYLAAHPTGGLST